MKGKEPVVIGIDLGGTKIYCAVVNSDGKILATARKKTKAAQGFENTVERIAKCAFEAIEKSGVDSKDVVAAGIGSPGPLDLKKGKIIETPNLKWTNVPIQSRLESLLKRPVRLDNDGNVGLLGEHAYGAGKGADHLVGLFIGTGIGGGIIVDGKLLHGFNENAGELGHMVLDPNGPRCGCGNKGCLEAFASRLAIEREIRIAALHGIETGILDGLKDQERIRSKRISEAFDNEDPAVKMAVTRSAEYIGYGVVSLLNVFNPELVVLGGGVVEALGDTYVELVRKVVKKRVFKIALRNVRIEAARLKDDSAVLGAAKLAWDLYNTKTS